MAFINIGAGFAEAGKNVAATAGAYTLQAQRDDAEMEKAKLVDSLMAARESTGRRETHANTMEQQKDRQTFEQPLRDQQVASLKSGTSRAEDEARRKNAAGDEVSAIVAGGGATADYQKQFVETVRPYAEEVSKKTGVDPRLVIAQAALESDWGRKAPGNNYFGVKGTAGSSDSQMLDTTEAGPGGEISKTQAAFRKYGSAGESFEHYAQTIGNSRYDAVRNAKDLEGQIAAIGKSGYATDPNYGQKVGSIARSLDGAGAKGDGMPPEMRATLAALAKTDPKGVLELQARWQEHRQTLDFNTKSAAKVQIGDGGVAYVVNPITRNVEPLKIDGETLKFRDPEVAKAQSELIRSLTARLTDASRSYMPEILGTEATVRKLLADPMLSADKEKQRELEEAKGRAKTMRDQYESERKPLLNQLDQIGGELSGKARLAPLVVGTEAPPAKALDLNQFLTRPRDALSPPKKPGLVNSPSIDTPGSLLSPGP